MALKYLVFAILMFSTAWAQTEPEISETLDSLPPELKGKVNESDIALIKNKTEVLAKEKCDKNGGPDAFEKAQKAMQVFPECVKESLGLHDPAVLQREIEDAKPTGTVDEVFKKYCAKTPEAKKCFTSMSESVSPCFDAEERKNLKTVNNITAQLAEFICYKDGDRIALFIAEGGPECFQTKQDEIRDCVKDNLGLEFDLDSSNLTASTATIPQIAFGKKECAKFETLQKCFVGALEGCRAPTSANIVESLFKFVFRATPCTRTAAAADTKPSSAHGLAAAGAALVAAAAALVAAAARPL